MPVVTLKHPFDLNGNRYEALTLRRANTGAMRLLDRSGALAMMQELAAKAKGGGAPELPAGLIDKIAPFLAKIAGVEEAAIDALDAEDFFALFEKVEEVLPGGGPLSGKTTTG